MKNFHLKKYINKKKTLIIIHLIFKNLINLTNSQILIAIIGYGIIAVPTGIVSAAIARSSGKVTTQSCRVCSKEGHEIDAKHCKYCGSKLDE